MILDGRINGERELAKLRKLAADAGYRMTVGGAGHVQVYGPMRVSWWPLSKKMTLYVLGTKSGRVRQSAADVMRAVARPPPKLKGKTKRPASSGGRRWKLGQFQKQRGLCHWCHETMNPPGNNGPEDATVDHVIPLNRGGLNNPNNKVLAHQRCNSERGDDMPEVKNHEQHQIPDA